MIPYSCVPLKIQHSISYCGISFQENVIVSMYQFFISVFVFNLPLRPPFVIPKSCHHHVIRPLTYILSLNPSTWSGNPCCLSILHENTQHHAFPMNHEWYLAHTSCFLFALSGATACGLWSISVSHLNHSFIREEKQYPG